MSPSPFRISKVISAAQAKNLADAIEFAWHLERPLNLAVTIHLRKAGITKRPQIFVGHFIKYAADWLRHRNVKPYWVWVLENPFNGGLNAHLMVHLPKAYRKNLGGRLRRWLKLAGGKYAKGVLGHRILRQPGEGWQGRGSGEYGPRYGRYLLKGSDIGFCRRWGLLPVPQGYIRGKRSGTSETLGATARAKIDWKVSETEIPRSWGVQFVQHQVLGFPRF